MISPTLEFPPVARQARAGGFEVVDGAALAALVARARAGEHAAQAELVRRYRYRIAGFVRTLVAHVSAVEDIVQLIMIKLARRLRWLRDPALFEPWLFSLARNTAFDHLRQRRRMPVLVHDEERMKSVPAVDASQAMEDIREALAHAMARLRPRDRQLVELIVHGESYRVVARRLAMTPAAVRARLNRVRLYLRASAGVALGTHEPDPGSLRIIKLLPAAA